MNTQKIREEIGAIEECLAFSWHNIGNSSKLHEAQERLKDILAELDKQPKVLTDERPYRVEKSAGVYVVMGPDGRWPFHFNDERVARIRAQDFNRVYKAARDNGYLAPTIGLTVEDMHKIGVFLRLFAGVIGDESGEVGQLRARLEAALRAKQYMKP